MCVAMLLLSFTFCECLYTCSTVAPWGVMIGMSGDHKSTLSPIPSSQDWACRSSSLLLSFSLKADSHYGRNVT